MIWFSLDPDAPAAALARAAGEPLYVLEGDALVVYEADARAASGPSMGERDALVSRRVDEATVDHREGRVGRTLARVADVPIAFGGIARHNLANALAALAAGRALGLPDAALVAGLRALQGTPEDNPGRLNVLDVGGATVLVDYAHNPHGVRAILPVVASLPAARRLLAISQAGDRDDDALDALAEAAMAGPRWDRIIVKELPDHLRGRAPGELPRILAEALARHGQPPASIELADGELPAARAALAWARPGDLLVLLVHEEREAVVGLLEGLREST